MRNRSSRTDWHGHFSRTAGWPHPWADQSSAWTSFIPSGIATMFGFQTRTEWAVLFSLLIGAIGLLLYHKYWRQDKNSPVKWGRILKYSWLFLSESTLG